MVLRHVIVDRGVLALAPAQARMDRDDLPAVQHRDRRRRHLDVGLLPDQAARHGIPHVVNHDMVIRCDLGTSPLAHLVALGGKRHQVRALLLLEDRVARAVLGRERAGVQPCHPIGAEFVELVDGVECHLVGRTDYPAFHQVNNRFGNALVTGLADPGGDDRRAVVIGEAPVLLVDESDLRGGAVGRRGGVVGHPHARHAAELLERVHLAFLP